jgi:alpha-1,4-digalacturonate transport system permease protein
VAPCCILFGIFFLLPLVLSIAFSFTNYDGWKVMDFVGIKNYITLFKDSKFYASMGRTLVYTICCLPFRVIIPLLIAVLVTSPRVRLKSLSRTMIYIPVLMSALVVGITINWMFSQEYGLINFIIQSFGGTPLEWSLNSGLATFVIGFASVWASIGFNMIIYVGGINNISPDLYEAASIDGANSFQSFLRITVPMLSPTTFLVVLLSTVNLLKEYALVQGITQGGPGLSTTYIIQYIFDKGFNQMEYGYASAISTVVMIVFALIAYAQFKVNNGGET